MRVDMCVDVDECLQTHAHAVHMHVMHVGVPHVLDMPSAMPMRSFMVLEFKRKHRRLPDDEHADRQPHDECIDPCLDMRTGRNRRVSRTVGKPSSRQL